jgi:threonine synthase
VNPIACIYCRNQYPENDVPYRCPRCGGTFDFQEDLIYNPEEVDPALPGIWRFQNSFGFTETVTPISLGEGNTPLIADRVEGRDVCFKLEYLNPTGSFKDRGCTLTMSFLASRGVHEAVEDSSGNAGASFAAYANRAGVRGKIFIPDSASGPKRLQIEAFGIEVVRILGPRSNASEAVMNAAVAGSSYASHAYLPFCLPGYATLAYEIFEELGENPGTVICPVGQGGLLLGVYRGFRALKGSNLIPELPVLIGVQARACAPLWALAEYGPEGLALVSEGQTLAEGIRVLRPIRGDAVIAGIEESHGWLVAVDEESILPARDQLARRGFYVEPTSAVVWPALLENIGKVQEPIVQILTGSGYKYAPVS